jgi:hypothetical protein
MTDDAEQIRRLIERWAEAVHGRDLRVSLRTTPTTSSGTHDVIWKDRLGRRENGLAWLIDIFGNESAARDVKEKWREKEG